MKRTCKTNFESMYEYTPLTQQLNHASKKVQGYVLIRFCDYASKGSIQILSKTQSENGTGGRDWQLEQGFLWIMPEMQTH